MKKSKILRRFWKRYCHVFYNISRPWLLLSLVYISRCEKSGKSPTQSPKSSWRVHPADARVQLWFLVRTAIICGVLEVSSSVRMEGLYVSYSCIAVQGLIRLQYFYNDVFRYTPEKDEWRKFVSPTCPGPRSAHAVASSPVGGGKLFLFGIVGWISSLEIIGWYSDWQAENSRHSTRPRSTTTGTSGVLISERIHGIGLIQKSGPVLDLAIGECSMMTSPPVGCWKGTFKDDNVETIYYSIRRILWPWHHQ